MINKRKALLETEIKKLRSNGKIHSATGFAQVRPAHKLKSFLNRSRSPAGPAKMRIGGPVPGLELTWVE